jgi:tRNA pseudouridine13 synthase
LYRIPRHKWENKRKNNDFYVSELINESFLKSPYFSSQQNKTNKFPLFLLEKNGLDSNHALIEIKKKTGLNLRILGIKDAKAITVQYASAENTKNFPREIQTSKIRLSLLGFLSKPLSKSILIGNNFEIRIHNVLEDDLSVFSSEINKIANFYGLQRFGSERMVTHLVGKAILKDNLIKH